MLFYLLRLTFQFAADIQHCHQSSSDGKYVCNLSYRYVIYLKKVCNLLNKVAGWPNVRCMADSGCKLNTTPFWHILQKNEQPYSVSVWKQNLKAQFSL